MWTLIFYASETSMHSIGRNAPPPPTLSICQTTFNIFRYNLQLNLGHPYIIILNLLDLSLSVKVFLLPNFFLTVDGINCPSKCLQTHEAFKALSLYHHQTVKYRNEKIYRSREIKAFYGPLYYANVPKDQP